MKIVYLSPGNLPSRWAHTFQVARMAEALNEIAEVELVTARTILPSRVNQIDLRDWYALGERLRVVRLPVHLRWRGDCFTHEGCPRFDTAAAWYARVHRPDLVYARSVAAGARCAAMGLATVVESHMPPDHPAFGAVRGALAYDALIGVVTVTQALRDAWVLAGLPPERIHVWPDAVDLERFAALPSAADARAAIGVTHRGPLAVYCGHLYEDKGTGVLVAAARLLPKVAVRIVGGWPEDVARLRERARGCESLDFAGFVANSQVPLQLAAADVLVLPNSARFPQARTTSPLKLFEYMAARRPIVASRIPAFEGLLRHGVNAWLVAPDSPEALADGIERVLASPSLAGQLAEQAWRDVQRYTWKRRAAEILASLEA